MKIYSIIPAIDGTYDIAEAEQPFSYSIVVDMHVIYTHVHADIIQSLMYELKNKIEQSQEKENKAYGHVDE